MDNLQHPIKCLRYIADNEIVFDVDNRELGYEVACHITYNLFIDNLGFETWCYNKGKSPHIHLKVKDLEKLPLELRNKYKILFILKYTPFQFHHLVDVSFYKKSRGIIAKENEFHHKYKTKKYLALKIDKPNNINGSILERAKEELAREEEQKTRIYTGTIREWSDKVLKKISIKAVAKSFGLDIRGNKSICPFHNDSKPSLTFYDSNNKFYCFGCDKHGNVVDFIALCREHNLMESDNEKWTRK